ncbi:hypothetical protein SR18_gp056c [Caulobacter phage SR18]|nr:hypothetical protein SR18_gp056c [Caulobacter phage SR18]
MCIFKKSKVVNQTSVAVDNQIATQQQTINQLIQQGQDDRTQAKKDQEDLITALTTASNKQLSELQSQNTALTKQIADAQAQAQKDQAGLLASFQQAQASQIQEASGLLDMLSGGGSSDTSSWYGQEAKKPNYQKAMDKNKALESGGLSSTNLTGAGGVPVTALTLGAPALLGA